MSDRRPLLGARPSSALALPLRSGVQWTPDFTAGVAELELESILNRFHLWYRTTAVVSAVLESVARPEEVRDRRAAAAALAVEAAITSYLWRRTSTWKSMLEPGLTAIDAVVGTASLTLASRALHVGPQVDGTSWVGRILSLRVAAVPMADRRGLPLATAVGVQLLPLVVWPPAGAGRSIIRSMTPMLVSAFVQGAVLSDQMRRKSRRIDSRALRWASEELDAALTAEEREFHANVLSPVPAVLRAVAGLILVDAEEAARVALDEESRLRAWLAEEPPTMSISDRSEELTEVAAGVRRLSRRLEGGLRIVSSLSDLVPLARGPYRDPRAAHATRTTIAVRGALGAALATGLLDRRIGARATRVVTAAADVAVVATSGWHQLAEQHDRSVAGWVGRLVIEASATAGVSRADRGGPPTAVATMAAVRGVLAATGHRSWPRRVAAATDAAMTVLATAHQVRRTAATSLDQARLLTLSTLTATEQRTELHDLRVKHRAFVHDGVAQVLAAIRGGEFDALDLRYWLETERVRIEAVLGVSEVGHDGDLVAALPALIEEFDRRGIALLTESSDLPDWMARVGGTIVEIVREALNNVVKHTPGHTAWCGILHQDDETVVVRVCDFATNFPVFKPGVGTGTATMIALARQIGADIEWFQTPTGGTEVRIAVTEPG